MQRRNHNIQHCLGHVTNLKIPDMGWIISRPPPSPKYVDILAPSTCECDLISADNQVTMRSLGWAQTQYNWCFYKKGKCGHRSTMCRWRQRLGWYNCKTNIKDEPQSLQKFRQRNETGSSCFMKEPTLPTSSSWTSSIQNCEKYTSIV